MLSATKDLGLANEILRFAQDDTSGGISWKPRKADESAVCTINRHLRVGIIRPGETPQYEDTSANALCDAINQVSIRLITSRKTVCFMHVFLSLSLYAYGRMSEEPWRWSYPKECEMEKYRPGASMFEPATYRIGILGTLDKKWSDYCGGMTIEHDLVLNQYPMTTLTGQLIDQSALIGVLNSLFDMGCPIISVECVEAQ